MLQYCICEKTRIIIPYKNGFPKCIKWDLRELPPDLISSKKRKKIVVQEVRIQTHHLCNVIQILIYITEN